MSIEGMATWNAARLRWNAAERAIAAEADMEAGRPVARFLPTLAEHRAATRRARLAQMARERRQDGPGAAKRAGRQVRTTRRQVPGWVVHQLARGRSEGHADERDLRAACRRC